MQSDKPVNIKAVQSAVASLGMTILGGFVPSNDDPLDAGQVLIIANAGSRMWKVFSTSPEITDRAPNPLDRWTKRCLTTVSEQLAARIVFPFDGPPHLPFQRWAARALPGIAPSPIGIAIHPEWGLWWALRAAILLDDPLVMPAKPKAVSPCLSCALQPCLNACPVQAFSIDGYKVDTCSQHVQRSTDCRPRGCQARLACPIGATFRYEQAHAEFHMKSFLAARFSD